jgi:signal transduction histidine kinase
MNRGARLLKRISTFLQSLRVRAAALLLSTVALAIISAGIVISGVQRADFYIERAALSQKQLEQLFLLSGRVSDYVLAAIDAAGNPREGRPRLASALAQANAVLDLVDASIEAQVALLTDPDERSKEATESLGVARMRAMLGTLDRQIYNLMETASGPEAEERARGFVAAFGISFTPLLSHAIEDERQEAQQARIAMAGLKGELTAIASGIIAAAALVALFLYLLLVRPLARRITETSAGAASLAAGALDTRLTLKGHDELTLLMAKFNRMASAFERRQTALQRQQAALQETIAARTAELRAANERLNAIDRNRRRFFTDISHELRTPLTVIRGEAEMTLRASGKSLPEDVRQSLETIEARSVRLNRRIDDMLRVARSERGELALRLSMLDLSGVAREALEDIAPLARQKQIDLVNAPEGEPLPCLGDRDWLRQVIGGLIANAVKYSPDRHRVVVGAYREAGQAVIEISDEGCGISDEDLPLVFDRFTRGATAEVTAEPGHGVGLAMAKWVIGEHGGNIRLESPGRLWKTKGSTRRGLTALVSLQLAEQMADRV